MFANLMDKMGDPQLAVITLSKNTHHSSIIFFIAFIFMLIFVLGPLRLGYKTRYGVKVCILILLGIALYNNYIGSKFIQEKYAEQLENEASWQPVRSHVMYTNVYMLFIVLLMVCFVFF